MAFQWRGYGVYRPHYAKVLSWEAVVFVFSRWPWMILGSAVAVRDWLTGSYVDFRVTPKGAGAVGPAPARVLLPYAVLSLASALPALVVSDADYASGFYIFAILNAATYAVVFAVIVIQHARENAIKVTGFVREPITIGMSVLRLALPIIAAKKNGSKGVNSIAWGAKYFSLTEVTFGVAGAGRAGESSVTFHPKWTISEGEGKPAHGWQGERFDE